MKVTHYFTASLTAPTPAVLYAVKGDGARMAVARLMAGAEAWTVPEGVTAGVSYTLPDKTPGYYDRLEDGTPACMIAGNLVSAVLAPVLTGQAGAVKVSIVLRDADGGQVATFPFQLRVEQAPGIVDAEGVPAMGNGFEGKLFYGGPGGALTALALGDGVRVKTTEDGTLALVAEGGSGGAGGIDEEEDPTVPAWAKQPQKPAYTAQEVGALPAGTKIPGKTSELTNDAGFVDKAVSDLTNYYTKAQTQELIAAIPRFRVTVVQQLPAAGEELVLYLVPFATAEGQYLEYIWADGRWETIGSQRVDLTGYATEEWVQEYVEEHSGQNLDLDTTLTKSGEAADAKAVGDALGKIEEKIPSIEGLAKTEDIPTKPEDIGAQPKGNYASPDDIPKVPSWAMQASKPAYTASDVGALPSTYTPPNQTAEQVGADPKGTAAAAVSAHNTNNAAHNDIRLLIEGLTTRLNALANSTDTDLDQMAELVAYIKSNKSLIDGITTSKVSVSDIINNLTTNVANKPLSAAQGVALKTLIDAITIPTKVSQLVNDKGYLTQHQDISGKVDKNGLTLGIHTDGLIYVFVDGVPMGNGVELPTGGIDGYVDSDKNIVVRGLADGSYTFHFEMEDGSLSEGYNLVKDSNIYYTVTKNLTNCTISNSATQVIEGESYAATITANSGHELKTVSVTMGGSPVTVSGGTISIANVTGNIVITAVAEEIKASYTNLADPASADWKEGYRLDGSGALKQDSSISKLATTNFIACKAGDVVRIKGLTLGGTGQRVAVYTSNKENYSAGVPSFPHDDAVYNAVVETTGVYKCTLKYTNTAFIRFSGVLTGTSADVVITKNETI